MSKIAKSIILMCMLVLGSGCATGMSTDNKIRRVGVDYTNRGENDVYDFMIEFGKYKLPNSEGDDVFAKGGGRVFINKMPLPETMTVKWREKSGALHNEVVDISSYAPSPNKYNDLLSFIVNVHDENLEVYLKIKKNKKMDINHIEYDKIPIREK